MIFLHCILILVLVFCTHNTNALVHKFSGGNIESFYATHDIVVVQFCASWSTQCKDIAPEYEKASNAVYPMGKIAFGTVDAKTEGKLRTQYNVWSYPFITIRKPDGSLTPYKGRANASSIINFVKRATFTNFQAVSTPDQIDQFLYSEDVAVLGYFEEDKKEYKNFYEIVKKLQSKVLIGFVNNGTHLRSTYHIEPSPATVIIFKRFENTMLVYQSNFYIHVLSKWILENIKIPVNYLHPENTFKYLGFKIPGVLLFLDSLNTNNQTTITQKSFQQTLSTNQPINVTIIRNTTSPSLSPSLSSSETTTSEHSYTTHIVPPKEIPTQQNNNDIQNTEFTEVDPVIDVAHYTSALRGELPNQECAGDYLICLKMFHDIAPGYKDKFNFIYTDGIAYKPFMNRLGLTKVPSIVILDWSQEKHYLFDSTLPITPSNIQSFIFNFTEDNLQHYIRSAPPSLSSSLSSSSSSSSPSSSSEISSSELSSSSPLSSSSLSVLLEGSSRIMHVVADNFKELVLGSTKPVLLNIHLPWCGYCKSIWPAYEQLSMMVTDNIIIADFDASVNDMPREFPQSAWPTLFPHLALFLPENKMDPISMMSDPSLSNMIEFLVNNISGLEMEPEERTADEASYLNKILQR